MNHALRFRIVAILAVLCGTFSFTPLLGPQQATAGPVAQVSSVVGKAVRKFFGKQGAEEAAEYMGKQGGREIAKRVTAAAAKEGGDDVVQQIAKHVGKHGPDALRAMDNAPSVAPLLKALDEIPEAQVKTALTKLAAGTTGRELAETVGQHGSKALTSELKHPGVGMMLVRTLGDDGAELAAKMTGDQAVTIGKHLDDLAKLPSAQRTGLMKLFREDTTQMVSFVGDFVKANPGKSLFTVAATTVILSEPERILGGDEVVFDADGTPIIVTKKGIAGRTMEATGEAAKHVSDGYIKPAYMIALTFISTFFALWLILKLWHTHKREKLKTAKLNVDEKKTIDAKAIK